MSFAVQLITEPCI